MRSTFNYGLTMIWQLSVSNKHCIIEYTCSMSRCYRFKKELPLINYVKSHNSPHAWTTFHFRFSTKMLRISTTNKENHVNYFPRNLISISIIVANAYVNYGNANIWTGAFHFESTSVGVISRKNTKVGGEPHSKAYCPVCLQA